MEALTGSFQAAEKLIKLKEREEIVNTEEEATFNTWPVREYCK
jgi:hypothetical protein